jgi:hypothetical protein
MAHRVKKAERIIRQAYGITRAARIRRPVRFELLGANVAVAVVRDVRCDGPTAVKVARKLEDGRVVQMRKECRKGFESIKEFICYFDSLHERFGNPDD